MLMNGIVRVLALCCGATLLFLGSSKADDGSYSTTPSGGLVFDKTNSVQMLSERLAISEEKIDVSFVFKNITDKAVTVKVGFPIPEIAVAGYEGESSRAGIPHDQDFDVIVNGKPVSKKEYTKVTINHSHLDPVTGKWAKKTEDISEKFNELGLNAYADDTGDENTKRILDELGAICTDPDDQSHKYGCWNAQKTYYWDQVFPAGEEIHIHHTYAPWTSSFEPFYFPNRVLFDSQRKMRVENVLNRPPYCEDENLLQEFTKINNKYSMDSKENFQEVWPLQKRTLDYILVSGATWAGPIKKFTLEIAKGDSKLVSFCPFPGLKMRRAGNSFIGTMQNFLPTADLTIEFVHLNDRD